MAWCRSAGGQGGQHDGQLAPVRVGIEPVQLAQQPHGLLQHRFAVPVQLDQRAGQVRQGGGRSPGQGLANMTQRIQALGGSVRTDGENGSFLVTAVVPALRPAAVGSGA